MSVLLIESNNVSAQTPKLIIQYIKSLEEDLGILVSPEAIILI